MLTRRPGLVWLLVTVIVALFASTDVEATGGSCPAPPACTAADIAAFRCVPLGTATLSTVPDEGVWPTCSAGQCSYPYRMSGAPASNQVSILIPANVTVNAGSCTNLYAPGQGDPSGFGLGLIEFQTCRISPISSCTRDFTILTSQASSDKTDTLRKSGSQKFFGPILGPAIGPPIRTSEATTTDGDGNTLKITKDAQGNIVAATATGPTGADLNAKIFNLSELLLCVPTGNPGDEHGSPGGPGYSCLPFTHITDLADLKPTGTDPCKVGGSRAGCYSSDQALKENLRSVDGRVVLERLSQIPILEWNYVFETPGVRHMGPMAQDFRAAFGLGQSDRQINTVDAHGLALKAIQTLYEMARTLEAKTAELEAKTQALEQLRQRLGD